MKPFHLADLFCGAGGTSSGALEAITALGFAPQLTAINHWDVAIATHLANHPGARHLCTSLDNVNPRHLFKDGELGLLWGSPECTHHSVARGGRPMNDQSRATAWCITRWWEALLPPIVLVENVPEFRNWGVTGADGRPLKSKRGALFQAWLDSFKAGNYRVEHRVLCAADYGDPTTRERLFIYAVRGKRKIVWPEPTHAERPVDGDMFQKRRRPWVPARQIIDWSLPGKSIFDRKKPLVVKTIRRILAGLERFALKAFLVPPQTGEERVRSVDRPLNTVTCDGRGNGLVMPFIQQYQGDHAERDGTERCVQSVDDPLHTATTENRFAVVSPFIVGMEQMGANGAEVRSVDKPVSTVTAHARKAIVEAALVGADGAFILPHPRPKGAEPISVDLPAPTVTASSADFAVIQPFIVEHRGTADHQIEGSAKDMEAPISTVATSGAHHALASAYLVHSAHGAKGADERIAQLDAPLCTVAGHGSVGLTETSTFLVQSAHGNEPGKPNEDNRRVRSVDDAMPTVTGSNEWAKTSAFLVPNFGERAGQPPRASSVDAPTPAVTGHGAGALVTSALLPQQSGGAVRPADEPSPTVATTGSIGLLEYVISIDHQSDKNGVRGTDEPLSTSTTKARHSVLQPFLVPYYGTGTPTSTEQPAQSVTTRDRFSLVTPTLAEGAGQPSTHNPQPSTFRRVKYETWKRLVLAQARKRKRMTRLFLDIGGRLHGLEITHRMLAWGELARAQGFRRRYVFTGTNTQKVKQIGNAVPHCLARALVAAAITQDPDVSWLHALDANN